MPCRKPHTDAGGATPGNHWLIAAVVVALCALAAASTALVAHPGEPVTGGSHAHRVPGPPLRGRQPAGARRHQRAVGRRGERAVHRAAGARQPGADAQPRRAGHLGPDLARRPGLRRHRSPAARARRCRSRSPGAPTASRAADGQRLADPLTTHFTVAPDVDAAAPAAARPPRLPARWPSPRPIPSSVVAQRGRHAPRWERSRGGGPRCRLLHGDVVAG